VPGFVIEYNQMNVEQVAAQVSTIIGHIGSVKNDFNERVGQPPPTIERCICRLTERVGQVAAAINSKPDTKADGMKGVLLIESALADLAIEVFSLANVGTWNVGRAIAMKTEGYDAQFR